jgi:hypothetical protein
MSYQPTTSEVALWISALIFVIALVVLINVGVLGDWALLVGPIIGLALAIRAHRAAARDEG